MSIVHATKRDVLKNVHAALFHTINVNVANIFQALKINSTNVLYKM